MADTYDPYREALVMETETEWPEELRRRSIAAERARISLALHSAPDRGGAPGIRPHAHGLLPPHRRDAGRRGARLRRKSLSEGDRGRTTFKPCASSLAERSYDIEIGSGTLAGLGRLSARAVATPTTR